MTKPHPAAEAFESELRAAGFQEVVTKVFDSGYEAETHTHGFDVRIMVAAGQFFLTRDVDTESFGPGQRFEFKAETPHSEAVGPDGATLIIGRRFQSDR